MEITITIHNKKALKDIKHLGQIIREAMMASAKDLGKWGVSQIRQNYLRGPKPEHLRKDTGYLIRSIGNKIETARDGLHIYIGTGLTSKKGFNYPGYWEFSGRAHYPNTPRPFLSPFIDRQGTDINDRFGQVFVREFKTKTRLGARS